MVKPDVGKQKTFLAEYAALSEEARRTGAKIFFADEVHFRADAKLRGKWVLSREPALVDSTSPRRGERASYYSEVCLDTKGLVQEQVDDFLSRLAVGETKSNDVAGPSCNPRPKGSCETPNPTSDNPKIHIFPWF